VPLGQTTADPGGTTIVVLLRGGGGSLLLKVHPPNASGNTKTIRRVTRMRYILADSTVFVGEAVDHAPQSAAASRQAPSSIGMGAVCRSSRPRPTRAVRRSSCCSSAVADCCC
jgi:hypothetical protein